MIRVVFELRPDDTLTREQVQEIAEAARREGMTPEQWVKRLVLRQVAAPPAEVLPIPQPAA